MILHFRISISLNTVTKTNCKPISQRRRPRVGHISPPEIVFRWSLNAGKVLRTTSMTQSASFGLVFLSVDLLGFRLLGGDAFLSTHSGLLILGSSGLCLVGELLRPQSLSLLL